MMESRIPRLSVRRASKNVTRNECAHKERNNENKNGARNSATPSFVSVRTFAAAEALFGESAGPHVDNNKARTPVTRRQSVSGARCAPSAISRASSRGSRRQSLLLPSSSAKKQRLVRCDLAPQLVRLRLHTALLTKVLPHAPLQEKV